MRSPMLVLSVVLLGAVLGGCEELVRQGPVVWAGLKSDHTCVVGGARPIQQA